MTHQQVAGLALAHGLTLDRCELGALSEAATALLEYILPSGRAPAAIPDLIAPQVEADTALGPTAAVRDPGRHALTGEDPYNAIVRWCSVRGCAAGPLAGMRIAVKDSIAIAGVPMSCGSALLSDFEPETDSAVIRRLLGAGAEIVAVTNMDELAVSGAGDSSCYGPTLNPFDPARTSGGSSGGSAASLWYERVDVALGTDQAGSVRIPASWCGVLGLKPTRGRVPYAGILGLDPTLDHVGVMSRTTAALADVFGVIAGHGQYWTDSATGRLHSLDGVTIGLLDEGFEPRSGIGRASVEALREPIGHLRAMGARLERVSLPRHHDGGEISRLLGLDAIATVIDSATGRDAGSTAWPALAAALGSGLRSRPGHLTPYAKLAAVVGWQLRRSDCGASVTAGRLGAQELMHDYDRLLERVDLVALPTTPTPARVLRDQLDPDRPLVDRLRLAWSNSVNTCQANLTGHPAINLPVAATDGLPVGLMLVAPTGGDDLLVRTAALYEREIGWTPRDPH